MQRVCFQLQVNPERIAEYTERHRRVWPEMLEVIAASGRRNYSIFLRPDGLLIGYYEVDDDAASARILAESPVAAAWEAESAALFAALDGRADQNSTTLTEVFNLEDQLTKEPL